MDTRLREIKCTSLNTVWGSVGRQRTVVRGGMERPMNGP